MKIVTLIFTLMALLACASQFDDPNYGKTVASHQEMQTINPDGQPPMVSSLDGPKGAQVAETYRKDDGTISDDRIVEDIGN